MQYIPLTSQEPGLQESRLISRKNLKQNDRMRP